MKNQYNNFYHIMLRNKIYKLGVFPNSIKELHYSCNIDQAVELINVYVSKYHKCIPKNFIMELLRDIHSSIPNVIIDIVKKYYREFPIIDFIKESIYNNTRFDDSYKNELSIIHAYMSHATKNECDNVIINLIASNFGYKDNKYIFEFSDHPITRIYINRFKVYPPYINFIH